MLEIIFLYTFSLPPSTQQVYGNDYINRILNQKALKRRITHRHPASVETYDENVHTMWEGRWGRMVGYLFLVYICVMYDDMLYIVDEYCEIT